MLMPLLCTVTFELVKIINKTILALFHHFVYLLNPAQIEYNIQNYRDIRFTILSSLYSLSRSGRNSDVFSLQVDMINRWINTC